ncbi:MAG TPA: septum formation family protein [Candidatus Deferrimicrobiaceae bacterium]|nr:septum formation family protein [Candidatus Deferrimicrobiaceae bacterium]
MPRATSRAAWPRRLVVLAAAVATAGLAGCQTVGPAALEVGDCLDPPAFVGDIAELRPKPCSEPHGAEVFLVDALPPGSAYPSANELRAFITDRCIPAYETYTGVDLMTQDDMDVGWLPPTEEDWAAGRRRIICYAVPYEQGRQTTGSIRRP